jgi:hypothetical protein
MLMELLGRFPGGTRLDGIGVLGGEGRVAGGFALRLQSGLEVYGTSAADGSVQVLCLTHARPDKTEALASDTAALTRLARDVRLVLVDWCRCAVIPADDPALQRYFAQTG